MHTSPSEVLEPDDDDDDAPDSPLDPELPASELSSLDVSVFGPLDSVDAVLLVDTLPDDDASSVSAGGSLPPHAVVTKRTSLRSSIARIMPRVAAPRFG